MDRIHVLAVRRTRYPQKSNVGNEYIVAASIERSFDGSAEKGPPGRGLLLQGIWLYSTAGDANKTSDRIAATLPHTAFSVYGAMQ